MKLLIKTQMRLLMDFDPKKDYYKILGLNPDASEKEIKSAYYMMAKKHHPDLNGGKQSNDFKEMTNAYDILSDLNKKKDYDAVRRGESATNAFYANARQKPTGTAGGFNDYNNNREYYNENFEEKIREKFRRAGFNNDKFSKFQYKDPKTGEWKSYGNAQGNPFFKDFEDLFKKASQQQSKYNNTHNSYSHYSTHESSNSSQYPFESGSHHKNNKNEQFHNEDLNDPNRFANMGYNPYTQNSNESGNQNKTNNNTNFNNSNAKSNEDFDNFNYDYTPIILQQYIKKIVIVFGFFLIFSIVFKKKARDDYYFNNGLGTQGVNQGYSSYSQFANESGKNARNKEEELDPYDENVKIKVK